MGFHKGKSCNLITNLITIFRKNTIGRDREGEKAGRDPPKLSMCQFFKFSLALRYVTMVLGVLINKGHIILSHYFITSNSITHYGSFKRLKRMIVGRDYGTCLCQ